jgi:hypothetical protein
MYTIEELLKNDYFTPLIVKRRLKQHLKTTIAHLKVVEDLNDANTVVSGNWVVHDLVGMSPEIADYFSEDLQDESKTLVQEWYKLVIEKEKEAFMNHEYLQGVIFPWFDNMDLDQNLKKVLTWDERQEFDATSSLPGYIIDEIITDSWTLIAIELKTNGLYQKKKNLEERMLADMDDVYDPINEPKGIGVHLDQNFRAGFTKLKYEDIGLERVAAYLIVTCYDPAEVNEHVELDVAAIEPWAAFNDYFHPHDDDSGFFHSFDPLFALYEAGMKHHKTKEAASEYLSENPLSTTEQELIDNLLNDTRFAFSKKQADYKSFLGE